MASVIVSESTSAKLDSSIMDSSVDENVETIYQEHRDNYKYLDYFDRLNLLNINDETVRHDHLLPNTTIGTYIKKNLNLPSDIPEDFWYGEWLHSISTEPLASNVSRLSHINPNITMDNRRQLRKEEFFGLHSRNLINRCDRFRQLNMDPEMSCDPIISTAVVRPSIFHIPPFLQRNWLRAMKERRINDPNYKFEGKFFGHESAEDYNFHTLTIEDANHFTRSQTGSLFRRLIQRFLKNHYLMNFIFALCVVNGILIVIEGNLDKLNWYWARILEVMDQILNAILFFELCSNIHNGDMFFLKSGWSLLHLAICCSVFASFYVQQFHRNAEVAIEYIRVIRLIRCLRIFKTLERLQSILRTILFCMLDLFNMLLLTVLSIIIIAMLGCGFYKDTVPYYFGDLLKGSFTMYILLTQNGWNGILMAFQKTGAESTSITYLAIAGTFIAFILGNSITAVVLSNMDASFHLELGYDRLRAVDLTTEDYLRTIYMQKEMEKSPSNTTISSYHSLSTMANEMRKRAHMHHDRNQDLTNEKEYQKNQDNSNKNNIAADLKLFDEDNNYIRINRECITYSCTKQRPYIYSDINIFDDILTVYLTLRIMKEQIGLNLLEFQQLRYDLTLLYLNIHEMNFFGEPFCSNSAKYQVRKDQRSLNNLLKIYQPLMQLAKVRCPQHPITKNYNDGGDFYTTGQWHEADNRINIMHNVHRKYIDSIIQRKLITTTMQHDVFVELENELI
ncbi:hypothetical protein SNEBB_005154 [Seison nebaliae]|nr:hypothetical protein SNEBB_005154 [Seison nebaliae]